MIFSDKSLLRKLAIVLILKLAILLALWWLFVRDQGVAVDASGVATHLLQPSQHSPQGTHK